MASKRLISSFNGGELSPLLDMRMDSERALNGCRTMQNFVPKPQGGAIFRPPTDYLGETRNSAKARLIPFNFSTTTRFVIELTDLKARFWSNGVRVTYFSAPVEVTTPWPAAILHEIQYYQDNDVVWLTHPDHPPHKLIRVSDTSWQLTKFEPDFPPVVLDNYVTSQAPSMQDTSAPVFEIPSSVGDTTTAATSFCQELFRVTTEGNFTGTITVQKKETPLAAGGTWTNVTTITGGSSSSGEVVRYEGDAKTPFVDLKLVWLRLVVDWAAGTLPGTVRLYRVSYPGGRTEATTVTPIFWDYFADLPSTGVAGTYVTLRANARLWTTQHMGSILQIEQTRTNAKLSRSLSASGTSTGTLRMTGQWVLSTVGVWHGTVYVESEDPKTGEWEVERFWDASGNRNISDTGTIDGVRNVRIKFTDAAGTPSGTPTAYLQPVDPKAFGLVKILGYISPVDLMHSLSGPEGYVNHTYKVTALVLQDVYLEAATHHFNEGAWGREHGYPRTVVKHEQRLCFASTRKAPQTIWMAETNEPLNFLLGTLDTSPVEITLDSDNYNAIQWLLSQPEGLAVGTSGDEWVVNSGDGDKAITPTSVQARRQSFFGSAGVRAESGDDVALFVQRGGTKVREFTYSFERNQFSAIDLSVFSEHLLRSRVIQMAFASQPDGALWCVCGNGTVAVLTYERSQEVGAWWRFVTDGAVESVAVVYGGEGLADEVWLSVKRTINGADKRYVERIPSDWWQKLNDGDMNALCYADSRVVLNQSGSSGVSTITPSHLAGKTVHVVRSGAIIGTLPVSSSGALTLPASVGSQTWRIGLPYEGLLKPMRLEAQMPDGSAQGRRFRTSSVDVHLWKSYGASFRSDPLAVWDALPVQTECDPLGAAGTLQTGTVPAYVEGPHAHGVDLELRASGPLPTNVLSITPTFEVYG